MYAQYPAPDDLKHLICFFYTMEHHSHDKPLQALLPSATEVNGWQYSGRWRVKFNFNKNNNDLLLPEFYIVGQQTVSYTLTAEQGLAGIFGAALQPGAATLITGKPAHFFTNNPAPTQSLFPSEIIHPFIRDFNASRTVTQRMDTVIRFYRQFNIPEEYRVYNKALQLIYLNKASISVAELCEKLRVNERYLQREFREHIGIPPSAYLRMLRFNNVFTELQLSQGKQNMEALAMLFRYYDLSHFYKDHKKYFGIAPSHMMLDKFKLLEELLRNGPYLLQVQSATPDI